MKSFKFDSDSVTEFVQSWPVILVAAMIASATFFFGMQFWWLRLFVPLLFGICLGPSLFAGRIEETYPTARHHWLVSIGTMTALIGVVLRMTFPTWQGSAFDLTWLGVTFFTILGFVLLNRGNKEVIR